jgi:hypothetical protein
MKETSRCVLLETIAVALFTILCLGLAVRALERAA